MGVRVDPGARVDGLVGVLVGDRVVKELPHRGVSCPEFD